MIAPPKCWERKCRYFIGVSDAAEEDQVVVCKAFPRGIPDEIAYGDNPHALKYPGDGGLRFQPRKK